MEIALVLIAIVAVVAVALYLSIVRVIRQQSVTPAQLSLIETERDRLLSDLQTERAAGAANTLELGRLKGMLSASQSELDAKLSELTSLAVRFEQLQILTTQETVRSQTATATLQERSSALQSARNELDAVTQRLLLTEASLSKAKSDLAESTANLEHTKRANEDMKQFLADAQAKLSSVFSELAGKTFAEKAQLFEKNVKDATVQSKSDIDLLLKPFADKLGEFRQRIDTVYGEEAKERSALLGAVGELKTLNQDMAAQTALLTRALKGSAKVRGDWGELMLDNVLRSSGLEEGTHYDRQKTQTDDEGDQLRPDVLVRLPDDRVVVVDSKVNLIAWQEAMNAESPEVQLDGLRRHSVALRQHVKDLAAKNYPKAIGGSALEVTIAFIPIEGALSGALGFDGELQTYAFERRVVFASPNTLMALLRVVERLWTRDKIQRQAVEISDAGGKVLDALIKFLGEFDAVGKKLGDASSAFSDARKSLSESAQAAIPRARRLVELGTRGRKAIPAELIPDGTALGEDLEQATNLSEEILVPSSPK